MKTGNILVTHTLISNDRHIQLVKVCVYNLCDAILLPKIYNNNKITKAKKKKPNSYKIERLELDKKHK